MRLETLQTFDQIDVREKGRKTKTQKEKKTKRQNDKMTKKAKRQKDKKTKRQKDKGQRPKREFDIATSGQFHTHAMFSFTLLMLNVIQSVRAYICSKGKFFYVHTTSAANQLFSHFV